MPNSRNEEEDAFFDGYYEIPDNIDSMSFRQLADELSRSSPGTAKFIIIENYLLKNNESAQRKNAIESTKVGGIFSLAGVILGALITALVSCILS